MDADMEGIQRENEHPKSVNCIMRGQVELTYPCRVFSSSFCACVFGPKSVRLCYHHPFLFARRRTDGPVSDASFLLFVLASFPSLFCALLFLVVFVFALLFVVVSLPCRHLDVHCHLNSQATAGQTGPLLC